MNFKEKADIWGESFRNWGGVNDKKLLWRANLYMDDRYNERNQTIIPGQIDWNNENPWNDPVNNEWQTYTAYSNPLDPGNQLNSNGNQIPILQWTHPDIAFTNNGTNYSTYEGNIYSGVAYSWDNYGFTESSFPEFNRRMSEQAIASQDKLGANQDEPSLAPHDTWLEYDRLSYIPALGIYNHVDRTDGSIDIVAPDAGLNCTQFVLQAKTYTNSPYSEGTIFNEANLDDPNNSFYLVGVQADLQGEGVHGNINLLMPGDIIRCGTGEYHWAIVQSITFNQERETTDTGIALIHSSTFDGLWAVQKGETLSDLNNIYSHNYLLRPKVE